MSKRSKRFKPYFEQLENRSLLHVMLPQSPEASVERAAVAQELELLLRDHGLGWAIESFPSKSEATAYYLERLDGLRSELQGKPLATPAPSVTALNELAVASPYKAVAFLQALVSVHSPKILCAAWRILQGLDIEQVEVSYDRLQRFLLRVLLRVPGNGYPHEEYASDDIFDAAFLRHLGYGSADNKPLIDGFYALR